MPHKIAVVGAGWYGCHIASTLLGLGFDVTVFDRNGRLFSEASGNNQFRLHLGFHYPRHHGTRIQSRDGFMRFIERYPALSGPIARNIYAIPRTESLLDFATYKLVMTASGIPFKEPEAQDEPLLQGVEGILLAPERVLYLERARTYFGNRLRNVLRLNEAVDRIVERDDNVSVNGETFEYVIDATWGHLRPPPVEVFYEPTLLLYYEGPADFPAITLVDGPLCSVYPTEDKSVYTLSSVMHTPLGHFGSAAEARAFCADRITKELLDLKRIAMEEQIGRFIPRFSEMFTYLGPQISIKTKLPGSHDDRSCYVYRNGRVFNVMSGKIDTIFVATEKILSFFEATSAGELAEVASRLKADIALSP